MEKNKCEYSVVICCYNPNFEKLKKTIISCYKQEGVDFEIIISDDGSEVNYFKELKEWADKNNIKLVYNFLEKNHGTVKNIISATGIAKGEFISTISPGDYFTTKDALSKFLIEHKDNNSDLVFSNGVFYSGDKIFINTRLPFFKSTINKGKEKNTALLLDCFLGASLSFKREKISYLIEIQDYVRLTEDVTMTYLAILNKNKVSLISEKLIWYECGSGVSFIKNNLDNDIDNFINLLREKYSDRKMVKKTLKRWKINKIKNKALRLICLFFVFPGIFFKTLYRKFSKKKIITGALKLQKEMTCL